jgi:hypothetical protein
VDDLPAVVIGSEDTGGVQRHRGEVVPPSDLRAKAFDLHNEGQSLKLFKIKSVVVEWRQLIDRLDAVASGSSAG